jgi:DNA-directed RNA polymerase III subunit RPC2
MSWRAPFILLASLSMIFSAVSLFFLPPSPRWLTLHGREGEAAEAWDYLGVSQAEREKVEIELESAEVSSPKVHDKGHNVATTTEFQDKTKPRHTLLDLFSRDVRSRTGLAVFMMGMQQLSGIDGVLYVSRTAFDDSLAFRILMDDTIVCSSFVPTGRACFIRS